MMRIVRQFLPLLIVTLLVPATAAWAQPGPGGAPGYGRIYNPATVETVTGEVARVDRVSWGRRAQGVHLTLKTGQETLTVHLGPSWFVDQQAVKLVAGDKVEITGSRVDFHGGKVLIAREVKKGGQVMTLRDPQGVPRWAGQGGRRWRQ
jgi:hypothetical protein